MFKKIKKPILLDCLLQSVNVENQVEINKRWYIAKPLPYYTWTNILRRIYHSFLVLTNKAVAIQFAEDYFNKGNNL